MYEKTVNRNFSNIDVDKNYNLFHIHSIIPAPNNLHPAF